MSAIALYREHTFLLFYKKLNSYNEFNQIENLSKKIVMHVM